MSRPVGSVSGEDLTARAWLVGRSGKETNEEMTPECGTTLKRSNADPAMNTLIPSEDSAPND